MKIIGHTSYGYLAELNPYEIAAITGNGAHAIHASGSYSYRQTSHPVGTEFAVSETWKHLQALLQNETARANIAESLRAAATLIAHTPSPLTPPPQEAIAPPA
jgi:hypothetical protein